MLMTSIPDPEDIRPGVPVAGNAGESNMDVVNSVMQ